MKIFLFFLLALTAIMAVMAAVKFIRHERHQDSEIQNLQDKVQLLMAKTENKSEAESFVQNCAKYSLGVGAKLLSDRQQHNFTRNMRLLVDIVRNGCVRYFE